MRAWYTCKSGLRADLCLLLNRTSTRLIIRNQAGDTVSSEVYPSWNAAISAMLETGESWTSDMTGLPLV